MRNNVNEIQWKAQNRTIFSFVGSSKKSDKRKRFLQLFHFLFCDFGGLILGLSWSIKPAEKE